MECELFRPLDDDVLPLCIPSDHVVVFGAFEKTGEDEKG
jgi:hypothetical protein